jgi:glucosamine-6-phosphate deaminase
MHSHFEAESFQIDALRVKKFGSREDLDVCAAADAAEAITAAIEDKGEARIILASAPSQTGFLNELLSKSIAWERVQIFHMDEYVGIDATHPASFRRYQQDHVLSKIKPAAFHGIRGESEDSHEECERYAQLLTEAPIDVVCAGIGENGHLAFNDPPADLEDPKLVKVVALDDACRQQQVNDGCFPNFDSVPRTALTLTVPALLSGQKIFVVVPGPRKANAVQRTLRGAIDGDCPASALRKHRDATLYIDLHSASLL